MSRNRARDQRNGLRVTIAGRQLRRRTWPTVMALEDRRLMATFTVTNTADSGAGSLPYEIGLANSSTGGNTIDFDSTMFSAPLTINLSEGALELRNTGGMQTITGPAAGLTINGGGLSRVFQVDANVAASFSGLTMTGGRVGGAGGGLANYGTAAMTDCTISGNSAVSGGGLYTAPNATTTMTDCTVSGNSAAQNGGGLDNFQGTIAMTGCTITGNSASSGGGLDNLIGTALLTECTISGNSAVNGAGLYTFFGTNTLSACAFSGNRASGNGGGLYASGASSYLYTCTFSGDSAGSNGGGLDNVSGTSTLSNCTFSGESAAGNGGGLNNDQAGTVALTGCAFSNDSAAGNGGGLNNSQQSTATLTGGTFSSDSAAGNGGGLYNVNGTTTMTDVVISGSSATNGAGLASYQSTTTMTDCTVSGNSATLSGGGAFNRLGTTTMLDCSVIDNDAATAGGVGTTLYGTTTLTNCTVSGNSATGAGGGVYNDNHGTTTLTGCTVSANSAVNGGGISNTSGTVKLGNTILADNTAVSSGPDALGVFTSLGTNLIGVTDSSSGWVGSDLTGTSTQPLNPLLAPLGYYDGPTPTMPLLPGSPAINAGNNALVPAGDTTDQRGDARIDVVYGKVDIGAFESSLFTIIATSGSGQSTGISTAFPAPLVATVIANHPIEPVVGGLVTFTPPQSGASATLGGNPATISATSTVSVSATANGDVGRYTVSAGATGITNTASFILTNQAIPTITTTPSMTTVTLGPSPVTLKDTAVLSNGYYETGSITFTLYQGGTLVDTETVSVSGDGSYTTPTGYTLPTTGSVTGTYQWDASYTGDAYNLQASESDVAAEQVVVNPATPTITTTPSVAAVTLGAPPVTLNDTAVLSGGFYEKGTITFTLYQGGTLVDTETVSVSGNGSYATPTGYTLPTTGSVTGTYQWDSSYSGDPNNTTASENNVAAEQVVVNPAIPTIATTPNLSTVTLGSSPITLNDTATLSGGYYEKGTITFTLYLGGTLVDTETVSVSGDGSYTTPTGYTLPTTGTVTGAYQWDSSYSGDPNNTTASESNAAAEQVVVNPAAPTIATTPSMTMVTLGASPVTLNDTAILSGGYYEKGTITFTLYQGGTLVDTETVSVSGNGSYSTPTGYTLPTTGTVTGTYQWNSRYNGDPNNTAASESNAAAEQVVVNPATPTIGTTPSVTAVTLGTSPVTLKDTATLSGGYYEKGTITFTLYLGSTFVDAETVSVNGNGSYATPTGYTLPTTGTVTGTYQWNSSYTGDANDTVASESNAPAERVVVNPATPTIITTPSTSAVTLGTSLVTLNDTAVLSGGFYEKGTITFTLYQGGTLVDTETVSVSGNGSYATPTGYTLPTTGSVTGTYQWDSSYSGDPNNTTASESNAPAEQVVVNPATPTIAMTPSVATITLGASPVTLNDTVTLSGGYYEAGTITFTLYQGSTLVDTETVSVSGNGSYSTPTGYTLPTTGTVTGTYQWNVAYSGAPNNLTVGQNNSSNNQVAVLAASPGIATTPGGSQSCGCMGNLTDTAVLSGGYNPTATITFYLFAPGTTPNATNSNNVYTDTVTANGNGTYSTSMGTHPGGYAATTTGTYQWLAVYNGDSNNHAVSDTFGDEPEAVGSSSTVGAGDFATIGFWQNKNGQAVINSFNGGSTAKQLGNWLATTFPNLFGTPNPYLSTSLAGLTNAQVAAAYKSLWNPNGLTKNTFVQAFAVALGIYADTSTLGYDSTAKSFGFKAVAGGGASLTMNAASNGAAFGVANNSCMLVSSILAYLNSNFSDSTGNFYGGNQTLTSEANIIVNGINTTGDITNGLPLNAQTGIVYTPAQVRAAYGVSSLSEDGTGQTIAIVDAYNDPNIFQSVDLFDSQFGLTDSGPTLYDQYGDAASFLTVLNQSGEPDSLPTTDPNGIGSNNWELEIALDVEWAHAMAPGAQIVLVEANSQSLSDLMAAVATAAAQPGVSVVSMSWGFPEAQAVFAADEANYDPVFNVPGVTFLASTGDYGVSDPQYPAFSPNVVAVGGTTLNLNADNSYNSETGWGYYSNAIGMSIGSGGGLSAYEPEPTFQMGVQSTGSRTTPDVSMVADPATGAWIADSYNLDPSTPFEVVGGTSLSAPAFAGLVALVNQGRVAAGESTLNRTSPTETQQALYGLPQADYNSITSGSNGYNANVGYNLVTGLGSPVANILVPDLIDYHGPGTIYAGATVGPLLDATLSATWTTGGGGTSSAFNVFNAVTLGSNGWAQAHATAASTATGMPIGGTPATVMAAPSVTTGPTTAVASTTVPATGHVSPHVAPTGLVWGTDSGAATASSSATARAMPAAVATGQVTTMVIGSTAHGGTRAPIASAHQSRYRTAARHALERPFPTRSSIGLVSDSVLDELAADPTLWPAGPTNGLLTIPVVPTDRVIRDPVIGNPVLNGDRPSPSADYAAGLTILGLSVGYLAHGTGIIDARKRRYGRLRSGRNPI